MFTNTNIYNIFVFVQVQCIKTLCALTAVVELIQMEHPVSHTHSK